MLTNRQLTAAPDPPFNDHHAPLVRLHLRVLDQLGLREARVGARTACSLTGRARASHYRRLHPPQVRRPSIVPAQVAQIIIMKR